MLLQRWQWKNIQTGITLWISLRGSLVVGSCSIFALFTCILTTHMHLLKIYIASAVQNLTIRVPLV
jgi:hypothetical protein